MSLILVTDHVTPDEKAKSYYELDGEDHAGNRRRYEIIKVIRDDKEYEYRRDLGKATHEDIIQIPSKLEHTVGELREMCAKLKLKPYDKLDLIGVNKVKGW